MWAIIIITAILAIAFIANISDNKNDPDMNSWLSTNLVWAYILLILSIVILVAFAVYQMVSDFTSAKKGLMSLLFFGVVALISYLIASNKMPTFLGAQKFIEDGTITPSKMKLIDAGLIGTYIVLGISIASIIYASVSRLFK
jgi:small-conductance mechanosensitive channel